jgi:hypothetical protein
MLRVIIICTGDQDSQKHKDPCRWGAGLGGNSSALLRLNCYASDFKSGSIRMTLLILVMYYESEAQNG